MAAPLKYLLIAHKLFPLEKVAFSNRHIPKTVGYDLPCPWQALSA